MSPLFLVPILIFLLLVVVFRLAAVILNRALEDATTVDAAVKVEDAKASRPSDR